MILSWLNNIRYLAFLDLLLPGNGLLAQDQTPCDKAATTQTAALCRNLKKLAAKGFMFGHQDDLAYGVNWRYETGRSDVKEVVGDYPAVYGWELGGWKRIKTKTWMEYPLKKCVSL
jgi:mannan endo-1,4-beta-mannosidase